MAEIIAAIALICQVNTGHLDPNYSNKIQMKCQKELIKCAEKDNRYVDNLKDCILKRK